MSEVLKQDIQRCKLKKSVTYNIEEFTKESVRISLKPNNDLEKINDLFKISEEIRAKIKLKGLIDHVSNGDENRKKEKQKKAFTEIVKKLLNDKAIAISDVLVYEAISYIFFDDSIYRSNVIRELMYNRNSIKYKALYPILQIISDNLPIEENALWLDEKKPTEKEILEYYISVLDKGEQLKLLNIIYKKVWNIPEYFGKWRTESWKIVATLCKFINCEKYGYDSKLIENKIRDVIQKQCIMSPELTCCLTKKLLEETNLLCDFVTLLKKKSIIDNEEIKNNKIRIEITNKYIKAFRDWCLNGTIDKLPIISEKRPELIWNEVKNDKKGLEKKDISKNKTSSLLEKRKEDESTQLLSQEEIKSKKLKKDKTRPKSVNINNKPVTEIKSGKNLKNALAFSVYRELKKWEETVVEEWKEAEEINNQMRKKKYKWKWYKTKK